MKIENIIQRLTEDISSNRAKIIDDFGKAYIASRYEYDIKDLLIKGKLELLETRESPTKTVYQFRIKRGRPKIFRKSK